MGRPVTGSRRTGTLIAAAILSVGLLFMATANGLVTFGWGWSAVLLCLCAGAMLIALGQPSRALYVGALARYTDQPRSLWSLRAGTLATAPVAGLGPVLYALLALAQALEEPAVRAVSLDWRRAVGTALVGVGFVLGAGELGLQVGSDTLVWPLLIAASGLSAFWWANWPSPVAQRVIAGTLAIWALFWAAFSSEIDGLVLAGIAGAIAITLVVAPRWLRHSRVLAVERARRARSEERAEVAELVHDSVLQTLALIQSRADDPGEVRALARGQERKLRSVLWGGSTHTNGSIAAALRAVAAEVEETHRVKIDVVTVGDGGLDERLGALVAAAHEALVNAARHSEGSPVSLFAEVSDAGVTAYVRDRGPGFDLEAVPADRRGVRDSIVARMERHGGQAALRTAPGGGCEVRLMMERTR
jgi:signal transduction histidine kinase